MIWVLVTLKRLKILRKHFLQTKVKHANYHARNDKASTLDFLVEWFLKQDFMI